jgi:ADP-dependent NAD(P)H-hydrate dehydratase
LTPTEVTPLVLAELRPPVPAADATKGDRGTVLVVGGSAETAGALILAGLAALRVGAGKLQLATDPALTTALAIAVPEARVVGFEKVPDLASRADVVLLGPGVLDPGPMDDLLAAVVEAEPAGLVVDAGALAAAGRRRSVGRRAVLVPNQDEVELLGGEPQEVAARLDAVVACRAADTVVHAPDGRCWIERSGTVGLATSGSGDVAAGAVAGLLASGAHGVAAAVWGVHLHGAAGERLAARIGPLGFLARELVDELRAPD